MHLPVLDRYKAVYWNI